jgi:predicted O-methyltransferase YrrM
MDGARHEPDLAMTASALRRVFRAAAPRAARTLVARIRLPRAVQDRWPVPATVARQIAAFNATCNRLPGGWCPVDKQFLLAHLIAANRLSSAVEIGVFQGGSLLPMAAAMATTGGIATGIDPYSSDCAVEHDNAERVTAVLGNEWHHRVDWDGLWARVNQAVADAGLTSHARLIRKPSSAAVHDVADGIDLLHIDGNHDADAVAADIAAYVPKVRPGGFVVVDDTAWDTIHPQYEALKRSRTVVYEAWTAGDPRPSWGVLQNGASRDALQRDPHR